MRMSDADWDTVLNTNLKGAFLVTKAFSRAMLKQRAGRIINIASVIGLIGNAGQCNYAASKAGLIGFTQSAAREFASRGVTVNAIAPGFIETDMTSEIKPEMRERRIETDSARLLWSGGGHRQRARSISPPPRALCHGAGVDRGRRHGDVDLPLAVPKAIRCGSAFQFTKCSVRGGHARGPVPAWKHRHGRGPAPPCGAFACPGRWRPC